ncbi:MAG: dephospho-CoA kinase, partial [Firmicutes bacterium]|nr:dephospho-CoA kinase [Bacillota bacterium]
MLIGLTGGIGSGKSTVSKYAVGIFAASSVS